SGAGGEHLAAGRKRLCVGRAIQHRLERDSSDFSGSTVPAGFEIAGGRGRNVQARRGIAKGSPPLFPSEKPSRSKARKASSLASPMKIRSLGAAPRLSGRSAPSSR